MEVEYQNDRALLGAYLRRRGVPPQDVDDVAQDVFTAMLGARFEVRPPGSLLGGADLCRALVSHLRDHRARPDGAEEPEPAPESRTQPAATLPPTEEARRRTMYGIAARVLSSYRRRRWREARSPVILSPDPEHEHAALPVGVTAEEESLRGETDALVHRAIATLLATHPEAGEVLWRYEIEEHPMSSVARDVGVGANTAWNRLRIAREELRRILGHLTRTAAPAR